MRKQHYVWTWKAHEWNLSQSTPGATLKIIVKEAVKNEEVHERDVVMKSKAYKSRILMGKQKERRVSRSRCYRLVAHLSCCVEIDLPVSIN